MDPDKGTVLAEIPDTPGVHGVALANDLGKGYTSNGRDNSVTVFDLNSLKTIKSAVATSWPLPGCNEPAGLAIDANTRRLFVGCHNKLMVILDADSGKVVTTLPIGEGVDANVFDTATMQIFSSQSDGTLTVVREETGDKFSVKQNAATQRGARTMALNPKNHDIYLVTAEFDEIPPADGQQRPRRAMRPNTFTLLVMGEKK